MFKTKTSNPKCDKCAKSLNGHCTATKSLECPLVNIQSVFSQFDKVVKWQAGKTPEQTLLTSVLTQAVLDCVHMYKPRGQFNPDEAMQFLDSKYAESLCKTVELDYAWFYEIANAFIKGVRNSGLKSIGHGRAEKNRIKRETKGTIAQ
jgi:hypothetical protein